MHLSMALPSSAPSCSLVWAPAATTRGRTPSSSFLCYRFAGNPHKSQKGALPERRREKWPPGAVRAGLPVISSVPVLGPLVNTILSPLVLLAVYAFGAFKFFSGFSNTTYADALPTKLGLTIAWPVLFLISQKYRSNFKKAVR